MILNILQSRMCLYQRDIYAIFKISPIIDNISKGHFEYFDILLKTQLKVILAFPYFCIFFHIGHHLYKNRIGPCAELIWILPCALDNLWRFV